MKKTFLAILFAFITCMPCTYAASEASPEFKTIQSTYEEESKFISLNECKKQSFSRKYVLIDAFRVLKVDKTYRQFVRLTIFAPIFAPVKK